MSSTNIFKSFLKKINTLSKKQKLSLFIVVIVVTIFFYIFVSFLYPNINVNKNKKIFIINVLVNMEPNKVHNMHGAFDNKVSFIDDFKQYEVVLDNSNKIMNNDLINGATFNYFSPIVNPVEHFLKDVYPWLQWGKSKYDITTKIERIVAYSTDFADTIDIMRKDWNKLSKNSNVDHLFKDVLFSDFFMGVLNDKSLSNYNFSKTDKWLKDDIEYEVFKNKIKEVVIKNLLNFKIK